MKVYIARYFSDYENFVRAYPSMAERDNDIRRMKERDDTLWDVSKETTEVYPSRKSIIEWFNNEAWHNQ